MKRLFVLMFVLLAPVIVFSQNKGQNFQVDYNEINGALSSKDPVKKDFGRYKGFEIDLFDGEKVNFLVQSTEFHPSLALVNPKGEIVNHSSGEEKDYASLFTSINMSGEWILYVIGNESAKGKFMLRNSIAEPNSFVLPASSDFCTALNYIVAHSSAYFVLMENAVNQNKSVLKSVGALDQFFDESDGSFNVLFYNGDEINDAERNIQSIKEKVESCIGKGWSVNSVNWKKVDDFLEKSVTFTEKNVDKPRYITITAYDFKGSTKRLTNRFNVQMLINKKQ